MSLDVDIDHVRGDFRIAARFTAAPGLTALFGRSGSGKTTLVDIVGGLVRPDRGRVAVDGQVLLDTKHGVFVPSHQRRIGYVFQDSRLFPHLSVRGNLLYGRWFNREPGSAAADLASVVELLGIGHLLERRPTSLSGGEKQRVAIARVILKDPRILILDEATSNLDSVSEQLIQAALAPLFAGRTSVVIAHRLSTILAADRILVLDRGRLVAHGTHEELLESGGLYATLYERQFRTTPQKPAEPLIPTSS
jgi:molybdate transport system ATP-binding protein